MRDLRGTLDEFKCRYITKSDTLCMRSRHKQVLQRLDIISKLPLKFHHQVKLSLSLINSSHLRSGQCRLDEDIHIGHIDAVPCNFVPVHNDLELGKSLDLLHPYVGRARDRLKNSCDFFAASGKYFKILAENLHSHVRADAGNEFIEPHFDGLREPSSDAGYAVHYLRHSGDH